jgi:cleavage and polyadenylation specificity factor subunit 1
MIMKNLGKIKLCPITETQPSLNISFDSAQACFIGNDKLVVSLHGGELFVVSLLADSMRSVRSFHFERAAASVLTTCVCLAIIYLISF